MIELTLDPVLISLGPFEIRYYGLVYVIGFILAYFWLYRAAKLKKIQLDNDDLDQLLIYIMLGAIIGARLFHTIFWEPSYYLSRPLEILFLWKGGLAFHGGLVGVILGVWLFCRKMQKENKHISFFEVADILVVPAALALALGRIANFTNSELVGTVTNIPWCFNFSGFDGCRHPSQLYAAFGRFIIFGILVWMSRAKNLAKKSGFLFWLFILLFGLNRFIVDFFRQDLRLLGLTQGQFWAILLIVVGATVLYMKYWKNTEQ